MREMRAFEHFQRLGEQLQRRWSRYQFDEHVFGELATEILGESDLSDKVSLDGILQELLEGTNADALQMGSRFSDLQLIPFRHSRFYIEVLVWLTGSTTIHEHAFDGAFLVLKGESMAGEYAFEEQARISSKFKLGKITMKASEKLTEGDVRTILPAGRFIHNVFHLARPSVTVVLRTDDNPEVMPQYEYIRPGVALQTQNVDMDMIKRIQARSILSELRSAILIDSWIEFVSSAPLDELYWTSRTIGTSWMPQDLKKESYEVIRGREGGSIIQAALRNERRAAQIVSMRRQIIDSTQRCLMAALLMSTSRSEVLSYLSYTPASRSVWFNAFRSIARQQQWQLPHELLQDERADCLFDVECSVDSVRDRLMPKSVDALHQNVVFDALIV